ncbi:PLP-dependent cysteine synthase family protein [Thermofilum pendens]|uniref:Pyridoxal-5'-phosphate-dependent enzyme, beta subunit n=1 Tax=Thermofilum pendens (strain DSM 2475 / Hrk 5) TaxID=368408 RepID=A1S012_THEPD|nr:cysteine synthase family protein [Thermofilum pendens]ABL78792.1 Pyridoxal-5'-phosphate-dependent enzyme, beta subunit [Thermofilum pendens Hrk 5]
MDLRRIGELVGKTPVLELDVPPGKVYVKLEYTNPTGSHKDRIAVYMLRSAVEEGVLRPGGSFVEASSGNTAVSLAWAGVLAGFKPIIFAEDTISKGKLGLLLGMGAEVHLVPRKPWGDPDHYVNAAKRFAEENGLPFLNQYGNEANWRAHYETTGPELLSQTGGVDAFVMGIGTGGTVIGIGKYLKERVPEARVVGVVPKGSPIAGGRLGDNIEGLASTFVPELYERHGRVVDSVEEVSLADALSSLKDLLRAGVLAGPSTGASFHVARRLASRGLRVAIIAADSVLRYPDLLSTQ